MPPRQAPKRDQIADWFKQQMFDGQLRAGDRLPSIRDIATRWDTGHNTVQAAIEQLRTQGLVSTVAGGGVFASPGRAIWGPQQGMRAVTYPAGQRVEVRAAALIEAPRYVAAEVGATQVIRREELTYGATGPLPIMLAVSWVPGWALPAVPELATLWPLTHPGGAAAMIAAATGEPLTWGWCAWESRLPRKDGRETPLLHLDPGEYINATVITWGTGDGETSHTVEYREMVVGPNRVFEAEMVP